MPPALIPNRTPPSRPMDPTAKRRPWSPEEHQRMVDAFARHGRHWATVSKEVGPERTVAQVRAHAQKYFLKLQAEGRAHEVPDKVHKRPMHKRATTDPQPKRRRVGNPVEAMDRVVKMARAKAEDMIAAESRRAVILRQELAKGTEVVQTLTNHTSEVGTDELRTVVEKLLSVREELQKMDARKRALENPATRDAQIKLYCICAINLIWGQ